MNEGFGRKALCFLLLVSTLAVSGCGSSKLMLQRSERIPAAGGTVRVTKGPNDNTRLDIRVDHLAPPERLQPGATLFVVWARPLDSGSPAQNLGALVLDGDLKGKLETVTSWRDFDLLITAESTAVGDRPTSEALLTAQIHRK